jgi:hypothetical protein
MNVRPRSKSEISDGEKMRSVKLIVKGDKLKMSSEKAVKPSLLKKRKVE